MISSIDRFEVNVIAVVVTYNRCALLQETIEALESQIVKPSRIVLVDNNSGDDTEQSVLSRSHVVDLHYSRLERNLGGAGGFKCGMQLAYDMGADWVWCMDDDCVPHRDALLELLKAQNHEAIRAAGFLASRVLWVDGSPCKMNLPAVHRSWTELHGKDYSISRIVGSSFVSMLVSRNAIEVVGFPVEEFFIWFDDAEYSRRISEVLPSFLISSSVVTHKTPCNTEPLGFDDLEDSNLWKYRYGVRNECSFHMRTDGTIGGLLFAAKVIVRATRARIRLKFWPAIIMSCLSGFFFSYTKYIEFPKKEPLSARDSASYRT